MPAMSKTQRWLITCCDPDAAANVTPQLEAEGAQVESQMQAIGVLVVLGDGRQAARWRRLPGVAAVEPDTDVDIGPPDQSPT